MDEPEAQKQIEQMVNFVVSEAKDRAAEIESSALEQFSIEKLKYLQAGKEKYRNEVQLRIKQMKTKKVVEESQMINKSRLKKAAAREKVLHRVKDDIKKMLIDLESNSERYSGLLNELAAEAMLQLFESEVILRVRQSDRNLLDLDKTKELFSNALKESGVDINDININIEIDDDYLPKTSVGGVLAYSTDKLISVDNTLDSRLDTYMKLNLP